MSNDYQGEVKNFAMIVPVPVVLKKEQVHVNEAKILQRLDGFIAPRLVEYFDEDPFEGEFTCDAGKEYQQSVRDRQETEAKTLANLTGWSRENIRDRIDFIKAEPVRWWENLWN